eukprot:gene6743-4836_t
MSTVENELALAKRFHALVSSNEDRRPALARRNILPTVVRFLRSTDRELRYTALDSIALLGKHPANHELLASNSVLEAYVRDIQGDTALDDPEINTLANALLQQLFTPHAGSSVHRVGSFGQETEEYHVKSISGSMRRKPSPPSGLKPDLESDEPVPLAPREGVTSLTRALSPASVLGPANRDVSGAGLDCAHMVTFDVPRLYPRTSTETLEHVLRTTKGVISYHLHPTQHQMRVYMICKPPILQQALQQQAGLDTTIIQDELILMGANAKASSTPRPGHHLGTASCQSDAAVSTKSVGCTTPQPSGASRLQTLAEDPTATRRASYWSLTRLFALQFLQTVWVYCSPSMSTIEARVAWQREALAQNQEMDTNGGASGRLAERLGKMVARLW